MTSLRRHAQANTPAASYWLRRVLDDGERRDRTSPCARGAGGEAYSALLSCFIFTHRQSLLNAVATTS